MALRGKTGHSRIAQLGGGASKSGTPALRGSSVHLAVHSGKPKMRPVAVGGQKRTLRERLGMVGAWNSCVGYGCLAIALIFVFAALSSVCGKTS